MSCFSMRRERLFSHLATDIVPVLFNGGERLRNPSNTFPFRGESHVLYLAGQLPPCAVLVLEAAQAHIFVEKISVDDAVWSGPGEAWDSIAARCEASVHGLDELAGFLKNLGVERCASLPIQDPKAGQYQREVLGRVPDIKASQSDLALAKALVQVRLIHDEVAQEQLRLAGRISVDAHRAGIKATRVGGDECEVLAAMLQVMYSRHCVPSFAPIVTVHAERLHQPNVGGALVDGDMLEADVGAEVASGFCGDITNTWPVNGKYSPEQKAVYDAVLRAHRHCASMLRPGVRYLEVHQAADRILAEGLKDMGIWRGSVEQALESNAQALFFVHGIGHLLGIDVHDMEDLGDLAGYQEGRIRPQRFGGNCLRLDRDLQAGMALTVEPGLYFIPELLDDGEVHKRYGNLIDWEAVERYRGVRGVRIERNYLITPEGSELLTPGLPDETWEMEEFMRS